MRRKEGRLLIKDISVPNLDLQVEPLCKRIAVPGVTPKSEGQNSWDRGQGDILGNTRALLLPGYHLLLCPLLRQAGEGPVGGTGKACPLGSSRFQQFPS